jgi:hypothetical protein
MLKVYKTGSYAAKARNMLSAVARGTACVDEALYFFTAERNKQSKHWGWKRAQFINFLENTLIPDLKTSGNNATAKDFETCVKYMR